MYTNYLGSRNAYLDEMYVNTMYYIYKISKINSCVKSFYSLFHMIAMSGILFHPNTLAHQCIGLLVT